MLEIKNVTKVYRPKRGVPVKALEDVSLKIQSKGMVFILGKSGSGKSTLLNIIGGLDRYDQGEIIIKGKSSLNFTQSDFDSYRNTYVGFVFQEYNILEDFTVGANIGLALELQGKQATNEAINSILKQVDLDGYGHRKPNELSGGQKQRVAIARALVKEPEIILADEPTGNLDSATGKQVLDTLKKLSEEKLVIVVSHDREFAETYGDRIIELADGQIIQDIERVKASMKSNVRGINFMDNRFIQINKGYQLTQEDLMMINDYLKNAEKDAILSLDTTTNEQIQQLVTFDSHGDSEIFVETNQERITLNSGPNDTFRLIKSHFPIKNAFRMGASGLKIKPIRLVFTILLSVVAFTLFGLSDTVSSYDKIENLVQSIEDNNIDYLSVRKINKIYYLKDEYWPDYFDVYLQQKHLDELSRQFGISFKGVIPGKSFDELLLDRPRHDSFYRAFYGGIIELTEQEIKDLGFTIIGEMPKNKNEIAITNYIFEHFKAYGFKSGNDDNFLELKSDDITSIESFLENKPSIYYNYDYLTITAVVDTNFNNERYQPLREQNMDSNEFTSEFLSRELMYLITYSYHGLIYAGPGFTEEYLNQNEFQILPIFGYELALMTDHHEDYYYGEEFGFLLSEDQVKDNIIFFNTNQTTLNKNEALINIADIFKKDYYYFDINLNSEFLKTIDVNVKDEHKPIGYVGEYTFKQYVYDQLMNTLLDYAEETIDTAVQNGLILSGDRDQQIHTYAKLMKEVDGLLYENQYLPEGKPGIMILINPLIQIIDDYNLWDDLAHFYTQYHLKTNNYRGAFDSSEFEIVGFFIPDQSFYDYDMQHYVYTAAVLSNEDFAVFDEYKNGEYAFAVAPMPKNKAQIRGIVKTLDTKDYDKYYNYYYYYEINNEVSYLVYNINDLAEILSSLFLFIGIGFCIFASLLLFNFIATSISYKRRDIGILRAIGARSKDVFSIFFSESLIIAAINFVLATIATLAIVTIINYQLREEYGILLTFFRFGIRQVILLILVSIGVAFIASFIPVYRTARKRPIEAIRNN